jgi:hypothetical protein
MSNSNWDMVQAEVSRVVEASSENFALTTVANALDLIAACRDWATLPSNVAKGYWTTIGFSWAEFEIEVFEDRLEVYRFRDQGTDIWYENHTPGQLFSARFLAELLLIATDEQQ